MSNAPLAFERMSAADRSRASAEFLDRLKTRRTVRHFSPEPVPIELIENAVRCAASAPSGANRQPWRFVVVADPDVKRRIRESAEAEERENYERRFPDEWLHALEPFETDWRKDHLEVAPYVIVVFRIDYGLEDSRRVKHYYVAESVGIATGFLLAALHWSGLATLVHTPSPMGFLNQVLERPANERPFVVIPAGYPAADARVPVIHKKELHEVMLVR